MNNEYAEALTEVDMILKIMPNEIINKIPEKIYKFISDNKSNTFESKAIDSIYIDESKLKDETKDFLSLIYRSYICDEETKQELEKQERIEILEYNKELNEKYNPDSLFKKDIQQETNVEKVTTNEVAMTQYKESVFKKIWNKIINIFK